MQSSNSFIPRITRKNIANTRLIFVFLLWSIFYYLIFKNWQQILIQLFFSFYFFNNKQINYFSAFIIFLIQLFMQGKGSLEQDVWLGKRMANDPYLVLMDKILPLDAKHHVVMIQGVIYQLQTNHGDKNGMIKVTIDKIRPKTQFIWQWMGRAKVPHQTFISIVNNAESKYGLFFKNCQHLAGRLGKFATGQLTLYSALDIFAKPQDIYHQKEMQRKKQIQQEERLKKIEQENERNRIANLQAQQVYHRPQKKKKKPVTSSNWTMKRR